MNDDFDITARDLAEQVIAANPGANGKTLGAALRSLIRLHASPVLDAWLDDQIIGALGRYCNNTKAALQAESTPKVSYGGRPMTSSIAVNGQMKLWTECSPVEFVDAVLREQNVVFGRLQSNKARRAFVDLLRTRTDLMAMPTLGDAIVASGWDADVLALDDLDEV